MSSKKARRREQREKEQSEGRKGVNPAILFLLVIGLAVAVTVGVSFAFGDRSGPGAPPWPGAVWSEAHGHWH